MLMDNLWQLMEDRPMGGVAFSPESVLLSLVLAFVLGQVLAWVYYFTHSGLSYSRSYVQSLILITVVVSMVMTVIGNNIITAVGLMGALALIRFRNVIKDTRDVVFIFCALVVGMASGSRCYMTAIIGTIILSAIVVYLFYTDFGSHEPHNGFLQISVRSPMGEDHPVPEILRHFCLNFTLISMQDMGQGGPAEYAYQLHIRDTARNEALVAELEKLEGVEGVNLTMQERLLEM
jgi:uncharacterized membrane protein YhiD involved in acid resistance